MARHERFCMEFFLTLANPIRISILQSLLEKEKNVTNLVRDVGKERTLISHNLCSLLKVNLISFKKKGKERIYYPNEQIVAPLFFLVKNYVCSKCSLRRTCKLMEKKSLNKLKAAPAYLNACLSCSK